MLIGVLLLAAVVALVVDGVGQGRHRRRARHRVGGGRSPAGSAWAARARDRLAGGAGGWRPDRGDDLVLVLDALARALRTGAAVGPALVEARPVARGRLADELDRVATDLDGGVPVAAALRAWARRHPRPGLRLLAATVAVGLRAGGDLARSVEAVAATERQRLAAAAEVRAQSAQARLSAVVVAVAPVAFTVVAGMAEPGIPRFLVGSPAGWACLVGGIALDGLGAAWMVHLTRTASWAT